MNEGKNDQGKKGDGRQVLVIHESDRGHQSDRGYLADRRTVSDLAIVK
jgi:DNA replication initiation complex subunit (GINS family)